MNRNYKIENKDIYFFKTLKKAYEISRTLKKFK